MLSRFEAVYFEGEYGERQPSWNVVEWISSSVNGSRSGRTIESFYVDQEDMARELVEVLQEEYNMEFYAECG